MTAPNIVILFATALCLIAAMCVWLICSNGHHRSQMERRRHRGNAGIPDAEANFFLESHVLESIIADHERNLR
ncbi:hypothetical protein [Mycolicibacterium helvum]|uniref:hypothetical protein n=1 Tax=Mycolicibacterium helvum TaxID=1534349 RepID=UPI0013D82859|nr:hypothetical protein [Mycolicibacterium helvum]